MNKVYELEQRPQVPVGLMTVTEIAALLNVSDKTVYYWVERRQIPFIKVGRHLRFFAREVINFFTQKTDEARRSCHARRGDVNNERPRSLTSGASARTRDFASEEE